MIFKTKQQQSRFLKIFFMVLVVAGIVLVTLGALREQISFFVTPSEITPAHMNKSLRLGGLVKEGSVKRDGSIVTFIVTDNIKDFTVQFEGILPSLFRDNQGVIADGQMNAEGVFMADKILAKHDERYMPTDIADKLKSQNLWKPKDTGNPS